MSKLTVAVWLAVIWATAFGAVHLAWVLGARVGLGDVDAADVAFDRGWFVLFNLGTAVACVAAALLALSVRYRWGARLPRWLQRGGLWTTAALLLARGAAGVAQAALGQRTDAELAAPVLLLYDPWFVLGGLAFGAVAAWSRGANAGPSRAGSASNQASTARS